MVSVDVINIMDVPFFTIKMSFSSLIFSRSTTN